MRSGEERYRRIHAVFIAAIAIFFAAGAAAEYYLKSTDMHVSDCLGNFIWSFCGTAGFEGCASAADFILAALRGFVRPSLCLIFIFLCGFTVYAPAVAFTVSAYSSFTFGALCMALAEKEISYLIFVLICASMLITFTELCVYSAYLGRELSRRSPPSAKMLPALPEVQGFCRATGIAAFKISLHITVFYAAIRYF